MAKYYVNKRAQRTGEHEVHKKGCSYFPSDTLYLGEFASCRPAVNKAREHYGVVDGCYYCCNACHSG